MKPNIQAIPNLSSSPLEVADVGMDEENTELWEKRYGKKWRLIGGFDRALAEDLGANIPSVREQIKTPGKSIVYTKRGMPSKRMLYSGSSPIRQIIEDEVRRYYDELKRNITVDELARVVADECNEKQYRIKKLIEHMHDASEIFLSISRGKKYVIPGHPKMSAERKLAIVEWHEGLHPVKLGIYELLSNPDRHNLNSPTSYKELEKKLMDFGWIKRPKTLKAYLKEMVRDGEIVKIGSEHYEAGLFLEGKAEK